MAADQIVEKRKVSESSLFSPAKRKKRVEAGYQYKHFEDVLEQVNPFGPYQIFVCICIVLANIEWSGNFNFITIVGSVEPDWNCVLKDGTGEKVVMHTDPNKCDIIKNDCENFTAIRNSTDFISIVSSFKLICGDGDKPEIIQMAQALALMIGSIVGGHLGDNFGRQFLFYMSQLGIVITSCMTTASTSWAGYCFTQCLNGFLYGVIEVEMLTLVLEYTNNQYRMIPIACFQWNIANMSIAFLAYLTTFVYQGPNGTNWQMFFVFLNTVTSPVIMAFMLLHESPRWLIAKGKMSKACDVLNDLTDKRWNGTEVVFNAHSLKGIRHDTSSTFYNFYHLFKNERFAKQSFMQMLSVFTYSSIAMAYFYILREYPGNVFTIVFLDGLFRLVIPIAIILLDLYIKDFTRRLQFLMALSTMGLIFAAVLIMMGVFGYSHSAGPVMVLVIVGGMINDSVFWMNIVQVTTQRYPTVIRCIAFGCLHSVKHVGTIIFVLVMPPLLISFPLAVFIIPTALIGLTLLVGIFLQPDTKGKALLDTIDEFDYTRIETALPKALYKMMAMHRVMQNELAGKVAEENRERWKEWTKELEKRESNAGKGHTNHAVQVSSDEDENPISQRPNVSTRNPTDHVPEPQEDPDSPWNYKSIAFMPHQEEQKRQREQLNSELKQRLK
ncbi:sugar transporter domain-containing protein [Ditylenchus destructor]|nr:sugar transporter domain-containing protein [Ditylenchus destructor]